MANALGIITLKSAASDAYAIVTGLNLSSSEFAAGCKRLTDAVGQAERSAIAATSIRVCDAAVRIGLAELDTHTANLFNAKLESLGNRINKIRNFESSQLAHTAFELLEGRLLEVRRDVLQIALSRISVGNKISKLGGRPLTECNFIEKQLVPYEERLLASKKWWPGWREFSVRLFIGIMVALVILMLKAGWSNVGFVLHPPSSPAKAQPSQIRGTSQQKTPHTP